MALFEEAKELLDISKPVNKAYPRAMAKEDKTRAGQLLRMVPSRFRPPAKNIRVPKGFQVVDNEAPDYEPVSGAALARGPKRRSSKASAPKAAKSTKRKGAAKSVAPTSKRADARAAEKDPIFRAWLSSQGAAPKAAKKATKKAAKKAAKKASPKKSAGRSLAAIRAAVKKGGDVTDEEYGRYVDSLPASKGRKRKPSLASFGPSVRRRVGKKGESIQTGDEPGSGMERTFTAEERIAFTPLGEEVKLPRESRKERRDKKIPRGSSSAPVPEELFSQAQSNIDPKDLFSPLDRKQMESILTVGPVPRGV